MDDHMREKIIAYIKTKDFFPMNCQDCGTKNIGCCRTHQGEWVCAPCLEKRLYAERDNETRVERVREFQRRRRERDNAPPGDDPQRNPAGRQYA
jgi:hypothetical protein